MDINLKGKNAIVGGASKGIGKATAVELALLGANVTLLARSEDLLRSACESLDTSKGQQHDYLVVDYSNLSVLKNSIQTYLDSHGKAIHIVVNNTGGPPGGLAIDANLEEFEQAFSNHLLCNQVLVQLTVEGMKAERYGRIINIISTSVKAPIPGLGVSNTIRGAVGNWSKTLAGELAQYGITVNNILPGATSTERLDAIVQNKASKQQKSEDEIIEAMKSGIPTKRFATPNEVGGAAAFLATPAAAYINGINLPVDGGRTPSL